MLLFIKLLLILLLVIVFTYYPVGMYFYIIVSGVVLMEILDRILFNKRNNLKILEKGIEDVSKGNLSKNFNIEDKNYGQMAKGLNKILHNYRDALSQMSYSTSQTYGITHDLAIATQETNQSITEVAQAIEQIALGAEGQKNSIEELLIRNNDLMSIAEDTASENKKAQEQWHKTNQAFTHTSQILDKLIINMENRMLEKRGLIKETGDISNNIKEINNIVDMVKDISHQTNLLALNAAIEAARAGEYGKGFSVVAEEVGKLAEMTESATANINKMIEEFGQDINNLLDNLHQGIMEEEADAELAKGTQASFEETNMSLETIINVIDTTDEKMAKQLNEMDTIISNLETISNISEETVSATQEISATVEEQASSLEHISNNAGNLDIMTKDLEEMIENHSEVIMDENVLNKIIEENTKLVNEIREKEEIKRLDIDKHRSIYSEMIRKNPNIDIIYLYDTKGNLLSESEDLEDIDVRNRDWFVGGLKEDIYVSDFYISYDTKKVCVTISSQVKDPNNNIIGVLGLDVEIES